MWGSIFSIPSAAGSRRSLQTDPIPERKANIIIIFGYMFRRSNIVVRLLRLLIEKHFGGVLATFDVPTINLHDFFSTKYGFLLFGCILSTAPSGCRSCGSFLGLQLPWFWSGYKCESFIISECISLITTWCIRICVELYWLSVLLISNSAMTRWSLCVSISVLGDRTPSTLLCIGIH